MARAVRRGRRLRTWSAAAAFSFLCAAGVWALLGSRAPAACSYDVMHSYAHDATALTQGLAHDGTSLFESTGRYGASTLRRVDLESGRVLQSHALESDLFGEGIDVWDDKIIQLTWRKGVGIVYDKETFREVRRFEYSGEGWGLTNDGTHLILSDGTSTLRFLDPQTFQVVRRLTVRSQGRRVEYLNELEYVEGEVLANIWYRGLIACISPETGRVTKWIDLTALLPGGNREGVLNGIAYDAVGDRLFVTGKMWAKLFEIRLTPP